jgi:tetratricopeptide (TPR) repeat protein
LVGWALAKLRRPEEAEPVLRRALDAGDTLAYGNLGEVLRTLERYGESEAIFDEALAEGCKHMFVEYGDLLSELGGREDQAEAAYRQAVAEGSPHAHTALGILLVERGQLDEAETLFNRGIELDEPHAIDNLAELYAATGRAREAERLRHPPDQP